MRLARRRHLRNPGRSDAVSTRVLLSLRRCSLSKVRARRPVRPHRLLVWWGAAALAVCLAGCSTTKTDQLKDDLKERGIEAQGGRVMRVFKF